MDADATVRLKVREGAVAWQEIDGEAILLDLATSTYLSLNGSATVLWPELVQGTNRGELVAILQSRYGLSDEDAGSDVDTFIEICARRNFLQP